MAEGGQRYELGRLILDYLRTFMWPVVIVAFALFYCEDAVELIKEREVKVLGVEIGPAVAQLQETAEQELADLQALVAELKANFRRELAAAGATQPSPEAASEAEVSEQTREAARAVETKLSSLRANLDREAQALREVATQQALPQQTMLPPSPAESVLPTAAPTRADEAAAFRAGGLRGDPGTPARRRHRSVRERAGGLARLPQCRRDRRLPRTGQGGRGAARCRKVGGDRSHHPDQVLLGHTGAPAGRLPRPHHELNRGTRLSASRRCIGGGARGGARQVDRAAASTPQASLWK
jgi:hypothetical protein